MHHVRQDDLPFVGSSHELSELSRATLVFRCSCSIGKPVPGPGPHRHPYDEIQFQSAKAEEYGR